VQLIPDSSNLNCKHISYACNGTLKGGAIATNNVLRNSTSSRAHYKPIPTTYDFAFILPRQPWSYAGLRQYRLEIEVEVHVPWA